MRLLYIHNIKWLFFDIFFPFLPICIVISLKNISFSFLVTIHKNSFVLSLFLFYTSFFTHKFCFFTHFLWYSSPLPFHISHYGSSLFCFFCLRSFLLYAQRFHLAFFAVLLRNSTMIYRKGNNSEVYHSFTDNLSRLPFPDSKNHPAHRDVSCSLQTGCDIPFLYSIISGQTASKCLPPSSQERKNRW